jgi:hypothetical protein
MNDDRHQPPPGTPARGAPGYSSLRLRLREEYPADHINCIKSTRVHENGGGPECVAREACGLLVTSHVQLVR